VINYRARWLSRLITKLKQDALNNCLSRLAFKIKFQSPPYPTKLKQIQTPNSVLSIRTCMNLASWHQEYLNLWLVGIGATKLKRSRTLRQLLEEEQKTRCATNQVLPRIFSAQLAKWHALYKQITKETRSVTILKFPAPRFKISWMGKRIQDKAVGGRAVVPRAPLGP
jgi:hypothetical protein